MNPNWERELCVLIKQIHFMRAFAAICIVLIHVTSGQALNNISAYGVNQFSRFASPLFIIIAGMVLVYIEMHRPSPSIAYFYKRRFSRVLIPYVVWSLLYFLYQERHLVFDLQWGALLDHMYRTFPGHLLRGSAFVHLYFILIMVQLYALFPFLYRWLCAHTRSLVVVSLLLTGGLNGLVYAHQLHWLVLPSIPIPYVVLFVNWIAYFVLGMAVMKHEARWKSSVMNKWMMVATALLWIGALAVLGFDGKATGTYAISVKPSSMLYGIVSFVLLYMIVYAVRVPGTVWKDRAAAVVEWFAKNSFLLYLLHPLCLNVLVKLSVHFNRAPIFYGEIGLIRLFALTMLTTCMGMLFINLTPIARWLGGTRAAVGRARSSTSVSGGFRG